MEEIKLLNNKILYFSGTGNSFYVAKKISEQIKNVEILKITEKLLQNDIIIDCNIFGLVFPVYAFGLPTIVKKVVNKIKIKHSNYFFVVVTHGGAPEKTLEIIEKQVLKKGYKINGAFEIKMPSNFIAKGKINKEEVLEKINDSEIEIKGMIGKIQNKKITKIEKRNKIKSIIKSGIIKNLFSLMENKFDKDFFVKVNCTGCGICREVCPVNNIILNSKKQPVWQHNCSVCMACINWCPSKSIYYKDLKSEKNYYHHPLIKYKELLK